MVDLDELPPAFEVVAAQDRYEVRRDNGRVVIVCADEGSAVRYSVLMNEAFGLGFKAGFRAARRG